MGRLLKFGTCGCGRKIKLQRDHNDPTIWACIVCKNPVCDWCYHVHYNQKHDTLRDTRRGEESAKCE